MKTYSVILNWNDRDSEEGTFGTTVRASGYSEAEAKAREEMCAHYVEEHCSGEDAEETALMVAEHETDGEFGGSVIELSEGAHWLSSRMEEALRQIVKATDDGSSLDLSEARAIIAEIDGFFAFESARTNYL